MLFLPARKPSPCFPAGTLLPKDAAAAGSLLRFPLIIVVSPRTWPPGRAAMAVANCATGTAPMPFTEGPDWHLFDRAHRLRQG